MESDQILVKQFVSHHGNILKRTDLTFEVLFSNNRTEFIQFSNDLFQTVQYEKYIESLGSEYIHLLVTQREFDKQKRDLNLIPLDISLNSPRYLRLQIYDYAQFVKLKLPFDKGKDYYIEVIPKEFKNMTRTKASVHITVLKKSAVYDSSFFHQFLQRTEVDASTMIVIDNNYVINNSIRLR
jgi:hypothetical protein